MLAEFLQQLFDQGDVEIGVDVEGIGELIQPNAVVTTILADRAATIAEALASPTPPADLNIATWAAGVFYLATFVYVNREVEATLIEQAIESQPDILDPIAAAFGADLVFSFAPDVLRMARATASADPLVKTMTDLLTRWPLSSVGIQGANVKAEDSIEFFQHPALRALYIDRIIHHKDLSRLDRMEVREVVRAAIGNHGELAPEITRAIDAPTGGGESPAND